MNLVIIGGVSANKMKSILASSADNVAVTIFPTILDFLNQASTRNISIDRIFLMQEAYSAIDGNPQPTLDSLSKFISAQYPSVRLLCLGADRNILSTFAQTFISPNHATFSVARATGTLITDLALQPIESLTSRYANNYIRYEMGTTFQEEEPAPAPVAQPAAQPAQELPKKKSLFGRRKTTTPSNAGNSPAAPLTPSQSGFGGNTSSPAGSPFNGGAQVNNNPFANGGNNNPFASSNAQTAEAQPKSNPFGGGNVQPKSNPFGGSAQTTNAQPKSNPFGVMNANQGTTPQPAQPEKEAKPGLFGAKRNPFAKKNVQNENTQANEVQAQPEIPQQPVQNNPFGGNPFGGMNKTVNKQPDIVAPSAPAGNPFAQNGGRTPQMYHGLDVSKPLMPRSSEAPVEEEVPAAMGVGFGNPFMEDQVQNAQDVQDVDEVDSGVMGTTYANPFAASRGASPEIQPVPQGAKIPVQSGSFGVRNEGLDEARSTTQNPANFGSSRAVFGSDVQNSGTRLNSGNYESSNYGAGVGELQRPYEPEEIDEIPSGLNPLDAGMMGAGAVGASRKLDMSRLQGNVHNTYDFKSATQVNRGITTRRDNNVEEISGITAAPMSGFVDDSEYQQQFAPAPRVVEKIVEREVYIDSGTETPAQKLLDAGKQVIIVVTGDRRSGVTYTCHSLASLYAKRVSTLLVDLDTETCGGQLYQDLEELMSEDENVLHGLTRAKNPTLLGNVVHHDIAGGYDYLFQLLGRGPVSNNDLSGLQNAIVAQRQFQLVIIDCPWNRLPVIEDLFMSAKILLCVDPDASGCYNITRMLDQMPVGGRFATAVERAGGFIAKQGTAVDNLVNNMQWLADTFQVDGVCWAQLRILGSADRNSLPDVMKKL